MQPLQEVLRLLPDPVAQPLLGEQVQVLQLVLVRHRPLGDAIQDEFRMLGAYLGQGLGQLQY